MVMITILTTMTLVFVVAFVVDFLVAITALVYTILRRRRND